MTNDNAAPRNYRRTLIAAVTFAGGLYFFLEFILPERLLNAVGVAPYHEQISSGFIVVGAMALGLGLINLFTLHGARVIFLKKGWVNSLALLLGLSIMMTLTVNDWVSSKSSGAGSDRLKMLSQFSARIKKDAEAKRNDVPPFDFRLEKLREGAALSVGETDDRLNRLPKESSMLRARAETERDLEAVRSYLNVPDLGQNLEAFSQALAELAVSRGKLEAAAHEEETATKLFHLLREGFFVPLGAAMFSLLGFYIAAAAYRAFRIRSFESALMMAAALIVMLGQMSFALRFYGGFAEWRGWLLDVPNAAAFRAIKVGASVAGLVLAFRMWFSIESESFSKEQ